MPLQYSNSLALQLPSNFSLIQCYSFWNQKSRWIEWSLPPEKAGANWNSFLWAPFVLVGDSFPLPVVFFFFGFLNTTMCRDWLINYMFLKTIKVSFYWRTLSAMCFCWYISLLSFFFKNLTSFTKLLSRIFMEAIFHIGSLLSFILFNSSGLFLFSFMGLLFCSW